MLKEKEVITIFHLVKFLRSITKTNQLLTFQIKKASISKLKNTWMKLRNFNPELFIMQKNQNLQEELNLPLASTPGISMAVAHKNNQTLIVTMPQLIPMEALLRDCECTWNLSLKHLNFKRVLGHQLPRAITAQKKYFKYIKTS